MIALSQSMRGRVAFYILELHDRVQHCSVIEPVVAPSLSVILNV